MPTTTRSSSTRSSTRSSSRRTTRRTRRVSTSTTTSTRWASATAKGSTISRSGGKLKTGASRSSGNNSSITCRDSSSSSRAAKSQQPQSQSQRKKQPANAQSAQKFKPPQPQVKPQPQQQQQQQQPKPKPKPPPRRHRVLIVGAGISGLAAARELLYRRYDVLVLEGRARPGGRLRTIPMRLPRDRSTSRSRENYGEEDGKKKKAARTEDDDDDGNTNDNDNDNNNGNRNRSGSGSGSGMGMASRLMAAVGLGSFVVTSTSTCRTAGQSNNASKAAAEAEAEAGAGATATTTQPASPERRQTRGVLKQEEQDQRRSTRSQTMGTPVKPPGRYDSFDTSTTGTSQKKKRKRPSFTLTSSTAGGSAGAAGGEGGAAPPPIHPLDQRYSTRLFAQENARTDIDYELVPVDLGGAFIHGSGYETDVKTGKTNRLDWSSSSSGGSSGSSGSSGGGKGRSNAKTSKAYKADINPLYQLVRSMGIATVPLDGCTLMDASGNNVDDVKSTDGGDGGGGSLDDFVQSKFNEILDDCHNVISQLKKLERAQRRGDDTQDGPKKKRRQANGGGGTSAKRSSTSASTAEVSVNLPDGTMATPSTDFATLFNSIASSKSIFLSGKSTLPADLFSWHLNNLEMSCGAPLPALGLKWNEDEQYNFGGDHVVLSDGWGRVIENLAEGSVVSASAGEGNGPVNIRYGCEVEGIRIVPPENYDGDLVDDVDDQGDDLSDYEALESDDDSEDDGDDEEDEPEEIEATAITKKSVAKAKQATKAKPIPVPAKKPALANANAKASTPPPARTRSDADDDAVKTRSRSKPQIRRSSRSNIGQHSMDSASRYSPTFESDLKKFSPIKSTPTKLKKKKESATPKGQSSKKKPAAAEPMVLSPDSTRDPDIHNSTVQVRTKLADGTVQIYEADHVIVTCPLGVLQVPCGEPGHVIFNPPLPKYKRESINKIGFGHYNKIAMAFPYRFWDELPGDDFWGVAASPKDRLGGSILAVDLGKAHSKSGGDGAKHDVPAMLMIFGGSYAEKMESMTDEELVGDAMEVVRDAWEGKLMQRFGGDTSVPDPVDFVVTRWGQDKFARGSFSYVKPGADGFVEALKLARPVFDPYGPVSSSSTSSKSKRSGQKSKKDGPAEAKRPMLLFAGEHTSSVYPSTIHGAFLSGIREATRLDLALEPAMNSYYEFDNKTVYDRTFDLNWRSRYGGIHAIGDASRKKKRKGMANVSSSSQSTETSRVHVMLEDAAILRGCDVHGTSVDSVARVSDLNFPIPAAHAVSGKRMTGKTISRRYNELTANGCNATRPPVDEKTWLVEEDQVFISGDGDGSEEELFFDWSAAAKIEREYYEEEVHEAWHE